MHSKSVLEFRLAVAVLQQLLEQLLSLALRAPVVQDPARDRVQAALPGLRASRALSACHPPLPRNTRETHLLIHARKVLVLRDERGPEAPEAEHAAVEAAGQH